MYTAHCLFYILNHNLTLTVVILFHSFKAPTVWKLKFSNLYISKVCDIGLQLAKIYNLSMKDKSASTDILLTKEYLKYFKDHVAAVVIVN